MGSTIKILLLTFFLTFSYTFLNVNQTSIFAQKGAPEKLNQLYKTFNETYRDSLDHGFKYAEEALTLARQTDNKFIQTKALIYIGRIAIRDRNIDKIRKVLMEALSLSKSINNEFLEADASLHYGYFLGSVINKPDSALSYLNRSYSIALSHNDTTLLKSASYNLVMAYRQNQDPINAIKIAKAALEYNKNDKRIKGKIFYELGILYTDNGNPKEAVKYFNLALVLSEQTKNYFQLANLYNNLAAIYSEDQLEISVKYRKKALDVYVKYKEPFGIAYTHNLLGMTYSANGRFVDAVENYKKAIELFSSIKNPQGVAFANTNLATEYIKNGKIDYAWPHIKKAIESGESINDKLSLCDTYKCAAIFFRKKSNTDEAIKYLKHAAKLADEIKNPNFLQDVYNELSLSYTEKGDTKNALTYLRLKNEIADSISKKNAQKSYIEMLVKYETIKTKEEMNVAKEKAARLASESNRRYIFLWSTIIGSVFIIAVFLFIYWKKLSALLNHYKNMTQKPFSDKRNIKAVLKAIDGDKSENDQIDDATRVLLTEKLKKFTEEDKLFLDSELTLNEMAKRLNTNTAYLSRIINEQSGMNFSNYINKYRIEEAKKLMGEHKQDSLTFEGIGKNCGFASRSSFNQAFKKFTGMTPTEYSLLQNK